jgi:hypothetical protein
MKKVILSQVGNIVSDTENVIPAQAGTSSPLAERLSKSSVTMTRGLRGPGHLPRKFRDDRVDHLPETELITTFARSLRLSNHRL